jgi:hypothetical protein
MPLRAMRRAHALLLLMIAYGAASLLHFAHNAVYILSYPNLPKWITPAGVYASWCAIAAVGALGYWVFCRISRPLGFVLIAVYALLGFGGLDHYLVAPMSAHSLAMNATILTEVATASALLAFVVAQSLPPRRNAVADHNDQR